MITRAGNADGDYAFASPENPGNASFTLVFWAGLPIVIAFKPELNLYPVAKLIAREYRRVVFRYVQSMDLHMILCRKNDADSLESFSFEIFFVPLWLE